MAFSLTCQVYAGSNESSNLQERSFDSDALKACPLDLDPEFCKALAAQTKVLTEQAKEGGLIMLDYFTNTIRPEMIKGYKIFDKKIGRQANANFWESYRQATPHVRSVYKTTTEYWYAKNPNLFDDLSYAPTPLKIAQEKLLFAFWDSQQKSVVDEKVKLNPIYEIATQMLVETSAFRTGKVVAPKAPQARLNRLLNDIRGASLDKEMANCFKIYAIPSEIMNSFNTVCSIFVHQPLYELLDDNELRAAIAHEMGHGVNGDSIKTFGYLAKAAIIHFVKLGNEELHWLMTDQTLPYFQETLNNGTGEMIMHQVADNMPNVELTADVNGAKILNRAGYSAKPLISALIKIHKVAYQEIDPQDKESFRNYPGLESRIKAIQNAMKF